MRVFLTGASGVMGRATIPALKAAGHEVVGLARTSSGARIIEALGAEVVEGTVFDRDALCAGMRDCVAVVNFATKIPTGAAALRPGAWRRHDRISTYGARVVAEAAAASRIPVLVQHSLSFLYADAGDGWIDEHSDIGLTAATEPIVVGETRATAFDGHVVVLRLGMLLGDDAVSGWMLRRARAGRGAVAGEPEGWTHVLHTSDVGTAVAAALTAPAGFYNIGAEPVTRGELADVVAVAAGRRSGRVISPLFGRIGGWRREMMARSQRITSQRFSDVTGWHPHYPKLTPDWFGGHR